MALVALARLDGCPSAAVGCAGWKRVRRMEAGAWDGRDWLLAVRCDGIPQLVEILHHPCDREIAPARERRTMNLFRAPPMNIFRAPSTRVSIRWWRLMAGRLGRHRLDLRGER